MMSEAWAITQGQVLYRDIPHVHPFFQFFIFIPFFFFLPVRLVPLAVKLMNIVLVYLGALLMRKMILSLLKDAWAANLSAVLFICYLGLFWWSQGSFGEFYLLFPILLSAYFILTTENLSPGLAIWVGILWGTAFFMKQIAIFDVIALWITFIALKKQSARSKAKLSFFLLNGILIVVLLAGIYPIWHRTVLESVQAILLHNAKLYVAGSSSSFGSVLTEYLPYLRRYSRELILATTLLVLLALKRSYKNIPFFQEWKLCISCSVLWTASVFLGLMLTGRFYTHYVIQLASPLILFYCSWIATVPPRLKKFTVLSLATVCLLGSMLVFVNEQSNLPNILHTLQRSEEIAQIVRDSTPKKGSLFLYREQALDIFYLSQRLSPNGIYMYVDMDSAHTNDIDAEKERRLQLQRHLPSVIVWGNTPKYSYRPSTAEAFFSDLTARHYVLKMEIEGAKLFVLKR